MYCDWLTLIEKWFYSLQEENCKDVMQMLLAIMCELSSALIGFFDRMEGFQWVLAFDEDSWHI